MDENSQPANAEIPKEVSYAGRKYVLEDNTPLSDQKPSSTVKKASKVFFVILLVIGGIIFGLPLLGLLFCLVIGGFASLFSVVLPSVIGLSSMSILISSYSKYSKKKTTKFSKLVPYLIAIVAFTALFFGGLLHKNTNMCELASINMIKPLLYSSGLMFSSILLRLKVKKL
jgi:hypothetical protein